MKVKSLSLYSVLLMFSFVLGSLVEAQAQDLERTCIDEKLNSSVLKLCDGLSFGLERPPTNCPDNEVAVVFENDCSEKFIPISVYCVNLNDRVENSREDEELTWPSEVDPLHLQYTFNSSFSPTVTDVSGQATTWTPIGTSGNFTVYESIVMIPLRGLADITCPPDSEEQFEFSLTLGVVTPAEGSRKSEWKPYPLDEYGKENDIFSCKFFPENCTEQPSETFKICMDCSDCTPYTSQGENRIASKAGTSILNISPNPFTDFLQYKYTSRIEEQISVHLLSVDGRLVLQEVNKVGIGENSFLLDTSHLPQGLYFMQINCGSNRILQRLTKMD